MSATGGALFRLSQGNVMRLKIDQLRQVVRHASSPKLSLRAVARLSGVSPNTVRAIRDHLASIGENWESLQALDDGAFEARLKYGQATTNRRRSIPNLTQVHDELQRRDITLSLLWEEFRKSDSESASYTQFTRQYRAWLKKQKISMRQIHKPGDKLFVDFCGRTIPIINRDTGEETRAHVFVGALGASGYLCATAVASQTVANWLHCHVITLEHLGGVPRYVVPDNLKAAVLKNGRDSIQLNSAYQEFAEHYGFGILPARPRKPKDKSLAEIGVQIVQRWVLARLRNHKFFALDELNQQISYWMTQLNERITRTYPKSRLARFQEVDAPALKSLPNDRYAFSLWRYQVRVESDYHIEHHGHRYSVPYQYTNLLVDIRATSENLIVSYRRRQIASHQLVTRTGISTLSEHQPAQHKHYQDCQPEALLSWAESIGPATLTYARRNLEERKDFANGLKAVIALRRDTRNEQLHERIESACAYALKLKILSYERLRSILRNGSDQNPEPPPQAPAMEHENLRGAAYYAVQAGDIV
ncbi:IS21 family transposase [Pseudomonas cichorii]|uniref:IS21 family transposase n=1 Tax=Pseudomonas cichorii TaxID=36746 RepID=UPI0021A9DF14|nr:IS21 family transposase [Pseudomonas cichorii]